MVMTIAQNIAGFIKGSRFEDLSERAREQLKIRILDSLGVAIGAFEAEPITHIRKHIDEFGRSDQCTLIGGGRTSPDFATLHNCALVRYLDFNDSYMAKGRDMPPQRQSWARCWLRGEYADASGKLLMLALAVAYQIQCRLSDEAPVRDKGFDHTTQGAYAVAGGVSKILGLDEGKTASALAISGAALNALRVTRTGALSNWKGLAYPFTAFSALSASFLAMRGITGPLEVFEGNKGFQQSIAGEFQIDWGKEDLERVNYTILKKFNAEIHSQSLLEGALDIIRAHSFNSQDIERIEALTFDVAYKIIGGGEEGNKKIIRTKEEADHSIPYMLAVAFLDGNVMPDQYLQERIQARDVQELLQKVEVKVSEQYSKQFPGKMLGRLTVLLKDGRFLEVEKSDYHGFLTRPMDWETVSQKFENLTGNFAGRGLRSQITDMVYDLEMHTISDLTNC